MPRSTRPKPKEEAPFLITPPRKKGKPPLPEPVAPKPGKPSLAYLQEQFHPGLVVREQGPNPFHGRWPGNRLQLGGPEGLFQAGVDPCPHQGQDRRAPRRPLLAHHPEDRSL